MRGERLRLAQAEGMLDLPPAGRIMVLAPRAGDDLSALPAGQVTVVTGFRPDHDAFANRGYRVAVTPPATGHDAALVCLPRARAQARALLAAAVAALPPGAPVLVDGQKTDGIATIHRDLTAAGAAPGPALAKAHGRLFAFAATALPADWTAQDRMVDGFVTRPGVFSADGIDPGSTLLAAALPPTLPARVADLGAGWGFLAAAVLARHGVQECHLIEADAAALDCARRNITDPRARFHWADARRFRPERPFDAVACNPPFHTGRATDPGLGADFITAAAAMLAPAGVLWLVANRHLPYPAVLEAAFARSAVIAETGTFRCWQASHPRRRPT